MKQVIVFSLLAALIVSSFASCENKAETGALSGAAIGATAGALISGRAGGALIGGALGAAAGGLIGYGMDEQDRKSLQNQSPQTIQRIDQGQPLSMNDIKAMAKAGIASDVINNQIKATHSVYHLSSNDIIDLKDAGVADSVVNYMIQTGNS